MRLEKLYWEEYNRINGINYKLYLLTIFNIIITYIHIHNWPLQQFSQDYALASYTTYVVCVNFIREWRDRTTEFCETFS